MPCASLHAVPPASGRLTRAARSRRARRFAGQRAATSLAATSLAAALIAALLAALLAACARDAARDGAVEGAAERARDAASAAREPLRVGTSFDYAPFSARARERGGGGEDGRDEGFDLDVARAFAASAAGRAVVLVPFRWSDLERDLAAGRFDVAMSGVTVRPERSLVGRFTVPVARTGAVVIARAGAFRDADDALARAATVAVNRGGHLERVTRARFARARVIAVSPNDRVLDELLAGRADAVVSDTLEAPRWLARANGLVALGPFTRDDKAYLVRAERPELARELDAWLLARERDGTLDRLRRHHFGAPARADAELDARASWPRTATVAAALDAAVEERLALMPLVAAAKRATGAPVEDAAREARVLDAGVASVARAARERGIAPPPEATTRAFFRAQIERAKDVQRRALAAAAEGDEAGAAPPDLEDALRPALLRIGDRIAFLLVERAREDARAHD